jgi:hypothetical protein
MLFVVTFAGMYVLGGSGIKAQAAAGEQGID